MSLVDHEGTVEYPFSQETVFKAIMEAAPNIEGLTVDSADEMSGRVTFKAGVSLASWGENVPVQLIQIAPNRTQMKVLSTPKTGVMFGGAMDLGKNRRNIEKIISAVSAVLSAKTTEDSPIQKRNSDIDELMKLKSLLDAGAITDMEFKEQKENVLSGNGAVTSTIGDSLSDSEEPIMIESDGKDNTVSYVVIGFIVLFVLWMLIALAN